MISEASSGQPYTVAWWMLLAPGIALVLTTLAFSLVGEGLRDASDPRTRGTTHGRGGRRGKERPRRTARADRLTATVEAEESWR
jgi:hypothetical protein